MQTGRWVVPRYTDRAVFEKDYPGIDIHALEVYCPGCRNVVRLSRKSPTLKIGGWCATCSRPVSA